MYAYESLRNSCSDDSPFAIISEEQWANLGMKKGEKCASWHAPWHLWPLTPTDHWKTVRLCDIPCSRCFEEPSSQFGMRRIAVEVDVGMTDSYVALPSHGHNTVEVIAFNGPFDQLYSVRDPNLCRDNNSDESRTCTDRGFMLVGIRRSISTSFLPIESNGMPESPSEHYRAVTTNWCFVNAVSRELSNNLE